jgi:hypothetical protein
MGHPQDATELKTDNTTADGITNKTDLQKRFKPMDMRYYWIQDRIKQGQFYISWAKHHSPAHHKRIHPFYIQSQTAPMIRYNTKQLVLQGCIHICTLSQTVNGPVSSLGPHQHDFTGGHMYSDIPTLCPPIQALTRATQQHLTIAQCAYARRQTVSCRTQQHHTITQCACARRQAVTHQHHTMAMRLHVHHQLA